MAADTDHHQAFSDNWGCSDLPSDHEEPQGVPAPEILIHGSISFGRYASESLAWEKWSVFSNNRCQEELEKFNGLVAQKKAYFEEYYRRIRALKAAEAEAERQETANQPESYQDEQTTSLSAEETIDDTGSKEEEQSSAITRIQLLATEDIDLNTSGSISENKSEAAAQRSCSSSSSNGETSIGNEVDISLSAVGLVHSPEVVSPEPVPWTNGSSETAQQNDLVSDSDMIDLDPTKQEDKAPLFKPKGTATSARDKAELGCRTRNNVRKPSERLTSIPPKKLAENARDKVQLNRKTTPKPAGNMRPNSASSHRSLLSGDADNRLQSSRRATPKPAGTMRSNSASLHRSLLPGNADDRLQRSRKATPQSPGTVRPNSGSSHRQLLSGNADGKLQQNRKTAPNPPEPPAVGNMRTNSASSHRIPTEQATKATVMHSSIAVDKSMSSVSTVRSVQTNVSLNQKVFPRNSTSRLPVNTFSHSYVQSLPKEITIKGGTSNVATENRSARSGIVRKSLDITNCNLTPKGRRPDIQRPKAMSTTFTAHSKSNQESRSQLLDGRYDREHQKEGKDQTDSGQPRYPKRPLSNASSVHKPSSPRPKKITPELKQNQREPRNKGDPRKRDGCYCSLSDWLARGKTFQEIEWRPRRRLFMHQWTSGQIHPKRFDEKNIRIRTAKAPSYNNHISMQGANDHINIYNF